MAAMSSLVRVAGVVLATGCFVAPPGRVRLGGTYHPTAVRYPDFETDMFTTTHGVATYAVGVHAASAAELPIDVGVGLQGDFHRAAYYLEGAALRRVRPWLRVGATGAVEWWKYGEEGVGGRAGITAEWTGKSKSGKEEDTSGCLTTLYASAGAWALGAYLEAGYRSMFDEKNAMSINMGISARWPAIGAIGYPSGGGGSSCD
jgi:hypothetical protein